LWKFNYSSESAHSVKINALSDLNFKFGFSKTIAKEKEMTSFLPLPGINIILHWVPTGTFYIKIIIYCR